VTAPRGNSRSSSWPSSMNPPPGQQRAELVFDPEQRHSCSVRLSRGTDSRHSPIECHSRGNESRLGLSRRRTTRCSGRSPRGHQTAVSAADLGVWSLVSVSTRRLAPHDRWRAVDTDAVEESMATVERTKVRFDSGGAACVGYVYHSTADRCRASWWAPVSAVRRTRRRFELLPRLSPKPASPH
jgi:hypothetical protein